MRVGLGRSSGIAHGFQGTALPIARTALTNGGFDGIVMRLKVGQCQFGVL